MAHFREGGLGGGAGAEHRGGAGAADPFQRGHLAGEAAPELLLGRELRVDDLDGDGTAAR
ncbi:hypothetical protein ATE80_13535 [Streptomyces kanasensis]|uniref:Uncharacterized protein n=1 Tax=Streptomyces kanasensis TaxID=936756 RepID=A0A117IW70_9ACTN|nr:hypothetical protein ATE80_13535 [Streptomyces kanasensis]